MVYKYKDIYSARKMPQWLLGCEQEPPPPKNNHGNKTNAPVPFVLIYFNQGVR